MTKADSNTERLYKLLGSLSPDLLADAFPEAGGLHNAPSFRARHAKRIGKMIALYAACAVILVGALMFAPKLMDLLDDTPVTTIPPDNDETPLDYPADYFRPDLVWANENVDPRRENAVEGEYHTIDFEFLEDENAVYAIYIQYFDGSYLTHYSRDFAEYSGAYMKHLGVSSDDQYRILEDFNARYYAGTREQIMLYFNYIEKTYTSNDDSKRIHVRLAFQTLQPGVSNGAWNPALLQPSEDTGFSSYVKCIDAYTNTPIILRNAKELTVFFTTQDHTPINIHSSAPSSMTHTVHYYPTAPQLSIQIDNTWYDIPWNAPEKAKANTLDVPEEGSASIKISLESCPHGELPVGQYRLRLPFTAEHRYSSGEAHEGEATRYILFTVTEDPSQVSDDITQGFTFKRLPDGTYSVSASPYLKDSEIVIPSSMNGVAVTAIAANAFTGYEFITSVSLPNTIRAIGDNAFSGCRSLETINIPKSVTTIGNGALMNCESLKSLSLPSELKRLESYSIFGCSSLTQLEIPDSVTFIGESALTNCESLTTITIPASVSVIERSALEGCHNLTSIVFEDPNGWYCGSSPKDLTNTPELLEWFIFYSERLDKA